MTTRLGLVQRFCVARCRRWGGLEGGGCPVIGADAPLLRGTLPTSRRYCVAFSRHLSVLPASTFVIPRRRGSICSGVSGLAVKSANMGSRLRGNDGRKSGSASATHHHPGEGRGPIGRTGLMNDCGLLRLPFLLGPGLRRGGGGCGDVSGENVPRLSVHACFSLSCSPAEAGGQGYGRCAAGSWAPAFAGEQEGWSRLPPPHPKNRTAPVPILQCSGTLRQRYGFRDDASRTPARD